LAVLLTNIDCQVGSLYWDASYAVALCLREAHPRVDLEAVSLEMIYNWALQLPGFADEPDLANDELLTAIYQDWYEAGAAAS